MVRLTNLVPRARFIGEFVLVVLGVLVALMVDSWIADRHDDQLRQEYLARLADDIRTDVRNLENRIEFFDDVKRFGVQTLERLQNSGPVELEAVVAAYYAAETLPFIPVDITYVDLKNTGNIRLLRDIELRTSLAAYYFLVDSTADILDESYRQIVRGIIPFYIHEAVREHCPTTVGAEQAPTGFPPCELPGIDRDEATRVFEAIRARPGISESLTYRVSQADVAVILFRVQRDAALQLLQALEGAV